MRRRLPMLITVVVALSLASVLPSAAELKLNGLLCDNMVLQRGMETPIWGKAEPGAQVVVTLGEQRRAVTADGDGRWLTRFSPLEAGGPLEMTVFSGQEITVRNIMVGDVWICSGQSNMAMTVSGTSNAAEDIANANYPHLRLFTVARALAEAPVDDLAGTWVECSPETVPGFSATAYFFGRKLHEELGVPVGLVNTSWGGTPAEGWTEQRMLRTHPVLQAILDRWQTYLTEQYPKLLEDYPKRVAEWEQKVAEAKAKGETPPRKPTEPAGPVSPRAPSCLYNAMIAPLMPYAIKGAIWYQGEANAGRAWEYRTLCPAMITSWRKAWGQGNFPFLWVQLPNYRAIQEQPGDSQWAELREAQLMTLSLPNTGMAVIIEHGMADNIHPTNKRPAGERMALWALARYHGRDLVYRGPVYGSMEVEGDSIRLFFDHADGGLVRRVTGNAPYRSPLAGFAIAGRDRKFVWANARVEGDTVVVRSDQVRAPVAVRYAWADNPICNLFNQAGLPASPFRTDRWPGVTQPN